jgi:type IV pilus biogenesis protein CpaD/CtpE
MTRLVAMMGLLGLLVGCAANDPLLSENTERPTGANELNIAAQVANPTDLVHGREAIGGADGSRAAEAIVRLRTGHVKPLPDSGISDLKVQSSSSPSGP